MYHGSGWLEYYNQDSVTWQNFIGHFFYLGAFIPSYTTTIIGVEWTLNVEAAVYVLFFFMILFYKVNLLTQMSTLIMLSLAVLLHTSGLILSMDYFNLNLIDDIDFHFSPVKWLALFFLGGLAYHWRLKLCKYNLTGKVLLFSTGIVLTGIYIGLPSILMTWLFAFVAFILIVGFKDAERFSGVLNNKVLVFFGSISYSFYLIHFIVIHYIGSLEFTSLLVSFGMTTVISFCWYYIFEKWVYSNLKRKLLSH